MVLHVAGDGDEADAGTDVDVSANPTKAVAAIRDADHPTSSTLHGSPLSDGRSTAPSV